ncbi:universal stress protein [Ferrovibrio sp.]|jgi:nucleotide-binding universal stress UspA family protein|uniref:universal stress protein n=1 Tax=Ferrovibrio sp. TaxID=1917215 RepID=UPI0035B3B71B
MSAVVYRDIAVHIGVDAGNELPAQLAYATALAAGCGAHLAGLFNRPALPLVRHYMPPEVIAHHKAECERAAVRARQLFDAAVQAQGVLAEWYDMPGSALETVLMQARASDLLLLSGVVPGDKTARSYDRETLADEVVLALGRPVLLLPGEPKPGMPKNVLIGWNGSREASRAVHDALPLLLQATKVTILCVDPGRKHGLPGAELARHLARQGVVADLLIRDGHDRDAGMMLQQTAWDTKADMVVMGAYGHGRLRETVLGGATAHMLAEASLPVLFSH